MLVSEWREIVDEVESLWGKTAKWRKADDAYTYARDVPVGAARTAVQKLFLDERSTAPPPAEVLSMARRFTTPDTAASIAEFCQTNGHRYGIVDETNGMRIGICGTCRDEIETFASKLTTVSERETGEVDEPAEVF